MALLRLACATLAVAVRGQSMSCPNGIPFTGPAVDLLRGTHLRVLEMVWPPYAQKDPSAPHGWTGYDIDLFTEVSNILGFTFEIGETPMLSGESYTEMLIRTVGTRFGSCLLLDLHQSQEQLFYQAVVVQLVAVEEIPIV